MTKVRFESAAQAEFLAAVEWYAERSQRVAWRFVAAVEEALDEIRSAPESWPLVPHVSVGLRVRRRLLKKLPYAVVFMVVAGEIRVIGLAHGRRLPGYWRRRTQ